VCFVVVCVYVWCVLCGRVAFLNGFYLCDICVDFLFCSFCGLCVHVFCMCVTVFVCCLCDVFECMVYVLNVCVNWVFVVCVCV